LLIRVYVIEGDEAFGACGIHVIAEKQRGVRAVGHTEQVNTATHRIGGGRIAHVHVHPSTQHLVGARISVSDIIIVDAGQIFITAVFAPRVGDEGRAQEGCAVGALARKIFEAGGGGFGSPRT